MDEARKAINSAVVESQCTPSGIGKRGWHPRLNAAPSASHRCSLTFSGIVKLMGRHAGYISAHATLASRQVDLCLIPEVEFPMQGTVHVALASHDAFAFALMVYC